MQTVSFKDGSLTYRVTDTTNEGQLVEPVRYRDIIIKAWACNQPLYVHRVDAMTCLQVDMVMSEPTGTDIVYAFMWTYCNVGMLLVIRT